MGKLHLVLLFIPLGSSFQLLCDPSPLLEISNGRWKVMMEYIGATGTPIKFDCPNQTRHRFPFHPQLRNRRRSIRQPLKRHILPLLDLNPNPAAAIKSTHSNVKALASLSGWSLGTKTLTWYNPRNRNLWIKNEFKSLKSIIRTYHLDGIDIDYEKFLKHNESFAYCVGKLITLLKNQSVISVATIAPFYSTVLPYIELFEGYGDAIDYVNYHFYTDKVKTAKTFMEVYVNITEQFDKEKILPVYEVNGKGIQGDAFFEALELLVENGFDVNGAMIFSADASAEDGFYYENKYKTQIFLLNNSTTSSW